MRYLRGALHNLTAGASYKLQAWLGEHGVAIISSRGGYISGLNRDEMFKIVVQPIAFKGEHLSVLVARFPRLYRRSLLLAPASEHDLFPPFFSSPLPFPSVRERFLFHYFSAFLSATHGFEKVTKEISPVRRVICCN